MGHSAFHRLLGFSPCCMKPALPESRSTAVTEPERAESVWAPEYFSIPYPRSVFDYEYCLSGIKPHTQKVMPLQGHVNVKRQPASYAQNTNWPPVVFSVIIQSDPNASFSRICIYITLILRFFSFLISFHDRRITLNRQTVRRILKNPQTRSSLENQDTCFFWHFHDIFTPLSYAIRFMDTVIFHETLQTVIFPVPICWFSE